MTARSKREAERSANGAEYDSQGQARSRRGAPTARNMTARGKREAERSASPLVADKTNVRALKGRNSLRISAFQALISGARANPGRRASRLPWAFIFRAVGAPFRRLSQRPATRFDRLRLAAFHHRIALGFEF